MGTVIKPEECDFLVVSQMRSGSHMLASALDSHPDIACGGEFNSHQFFGSDVGKITGCLAKLPFVRDLENYKGKHIFLTRKYEDIASSIENSFRGDQPHVCVEPVNLRREKSPYSLSVLEGVIDRAEKLQDYIRNVDHITVDYDDLIEGYDCKVIPEDIGRKITTYLGVDYHQMIPSIHRPTYKTTWK